MFKLNSISLSLLRRGNLLKKNLYSPLFTPLPLLSNLLAQSFAKMSKPAKKITLGDKKKSLAASDEKGAKLAKEEEAQEKKKKIEAEKKKIERSKIKKIPIKTFDMSFDLRMSQLALDKIALQQTRVSKGIRAASNLQEKMKIKQETKTLKERKHFLKPFLNRLAKKKRQQNIPLTEFFKTPNDAEAIKPPRLRRKTTEKYFNTEIFINHQFKVRQIKTPPDNSKRTGVIARKIGMTGRWDNWGKRLAMTVLQIDRCQVVQVKTQEKNGFCALQLGAGQKSLKKLKKPEIGHYLKNGIPPKECLFEFPVTEENILPEGFQIGARHFVPGQYVDITGITNGKGFQGTVKKFHFKMQPATHGNSVSHRVMGSTGNRTDPGKVFKNKPMPGRMGNKQRTIPNLRIYKIDAEKSLIYVLGAVPGRAGNFVRVRDAYKKGDTNEQYLNYPTFIPEKDKEYATEVVMEPLEEDPQEIYEHDNIHVKEDEKVDTSTTTTGGAPA